MSKIIAYQSIQTRYIRPTNTRGARIKATTSSGLSVTVSYDHALSYADAHWPAVQELIKKYHLEWGNKFAVGASTDDRGYVFVPVRFEDNFAIMEG